MHEELRHRILGWWSGVVASHPRWVLFVAVVGAVLALTVTVVGIRIGRLHAGPLRFQSDRNKLIADDIDWNQRYLDLQASYPGLDDLTVVIDVGLETGDQGYEQRAGRARQLADEMAAAMLAPVADGGQAVVQRVLWRLEVDRSRPAGLRMQPMAQFVQGIEQIRQGMKQAEPVLTEQSLAGFLARAGAGMGMARDGQTGLMGIHTEIARFARLAAAMHVYLRDGGEAPDFSALATQGQDAGPQWQYLVSENGRLFFLSVRPFLEASSLNAVGPAIQRVRQVIADLSPNYTDMAVGLTGIDVLESEETGAAMRDSTVASIIAVVLITALLVIAFHSWRLPLLGLTALLFGIVWTFGFTTVAVGHLQVISVVFAVILLGLGISYGSYLASRFELIRHNYPSGSRGFGPALRDSVQTVGPGVVTGAVTTAAAFCTTMLTRFTGVAEMGLIAAAGIGLCLAAMFSVYPAFMRLVKPKGKHIRPMGERFIHFYDDRWVMPFVRHPVWTVVLAIGLTGVSLTPLAAGWMHFDYNLLKLLPQDAAGLVWQQRIAQDGNRAIYSAVSLAADLDEARVRVDRFRKLATVEQVRGVGMLFPADEPAKLEMLRSLGGELRAMTGDREENRLGDAESSMGNEVAIGDIAPPLVSMKRQLERAGGLGLIPESLQSVLAEMNESLAGALVALDALEPQQRRDRLEGLQQAYAKWRRQVVGAISAACSTEPLTLEDLPQEMRRLYVDQNGRLLLDVYPQVPKDAEGPLDPAFLPRFVRDVYSVDRAATGPVVQIYESGKLIKSSYQFAGVLALLVVFALVAIDFQRLDDALLAMVPVGIGFAVTFGIMWLVGVRINAANIIVLPLMFGIGVDAGVHILHRYRQDPTARPLGLAHGTGKGVTITSLTTVIGFASLLVAKHRGISSLGFVLALGILLTMLACWTVMPACLELRKNKNGGASEGSVADES